MKAKVILAAGAWGLARTSRGEKVFLHRNNFLVPNSFDVGDVLDINGLSHPRPGGTYRVAHDVVVAEKRGASP